MGGGGGGGGGGGVNICGLDHSGPEPFNYVINYVKLDCDCFTANIISSWCGW